MPPDEVRRPISVLAVANSLGLPYETVRRYVTKLIRLGRCGRVKGGIIALASGLRRPIDDETMVLNVANARRFCRALKRAGVIAD
jgi:DeoR/GlpR family transcriptional regulator of sugar metabolism